MKDCYAGDIGDFGKLGMLRTLKRAGLTIGVNWYLTPDEENKDGRYTEYLGRESSFACDRGLCNELKRIVDKKERKVDALQTEAILPAVFFSERLDFSDKTKSERNTFRKDWHQRALLRLQGSDIVFLDPDNGLLVPSAVGTKKENKYVKEVEIIDYYAHGNSVIYYQHKARRPDSYYVEQQQKLLEHPKLIGASGFGLKFITTSQRYFFFIIQKQHSEIIDAALDRMIKPPWKTHFQRI